MDYVLVKHMGHDGPWLLIKAREEVEARIAYIKAYKPPNEVPLRLKLLGIVKEPIPESLQKACAAWQKVYAAWPKSNAARQKADAAWQKAYAAWPKANAARQKADAAWAKAINSKAGVEFHAKACGCKWTPEQPDILVANREES